MKHNRKWLYISYYFKCFDKLFFPDKECIKGGIQSACKLPEYILNNTNDEIIFVFIISDFKIYQSLKNFENIFPIYSRKENSFSPFFELFFLLLKLIRKYKFDLIYSVGYLSLVGSVVSRIFKIKHFSRCFGTFLSLYYEKKIKNVKLFTEWLSIKLHKDGIIMTDDGTRGNVVLEKMHVPRDKILFIPNGIDKEKIFNIIGSMNRNFEREKLGLKDKFVITNISRIVSWKRVDLVIESFKGLIDYKRDLKDKFFLLLVGDGSQRDKMIKMVEKFGLENVRFLGNLPWEECIKTMFISDCITCFYEVSNVGNVLIEALTIGRCVLARDTGDTKKIIKNWENGILFCKDENKLIKNFIFAVDILYNNPNLLKKIEEGAKVYSQMYFFTWEERIKKEYEWILSRTKIEKGV